MSKIIFLMVFSLAIINLKAQIALPVAATGNVLKDGTPANNAAIASTSTAGFKLAVNGSALYYGIGVNTVTSPTIYLRNLTASTGRIFALNSDNTGLFTISDATGTTSPLTHISRFVINSTGNIGIGVTAPTSLLHLNAGTAAAGTSPLKFTSGTATTTPEIGAFNFVNGLLMLDSSNTKRDTIATRGWVRTNISFSTDSTKFQTKFRSDTARTNTYTTLAGKQSTLVSGTSIKTINSISLLGTGDVALEPIITAPNSIKNYLNGYKKFVPFNTDSITEGTTNQFYTNARSRTAISITTTGTNGAATYNNSTGVLNIPVYAATGGTVTSVGLTSTDIIIGGLSPITSSGSYTLTLPIVNSNVGTFNNITLNAKGQATAGSNIIYLVPTDTTNIRSRLIAGNNITISGTYPNQTIASVASGGTVTNVAPITIGTTGTDLNSTVVTGTTTPVITLNVPTASASNRGALSSADWTSFNSKQNALSGTTNRITILSNIADISPSYIGQTSISTLGTIIAGTWNGTTIGANYGGTGQSTVTTGDIFYGSATNTWGKLAAGSNGQVLTLASGIPSWVTPAGISGWNLTGNINTNPISNFIGTIDNNDLVFRTNNSIGATLSAGNFYGKSFTLNGATNSNISLSTESGSAVLSLGLYGSYTTLSGDGSLRLGQDRVFKLLGATTGPDNIIFSRCESCGPGNIISARIGETGANLFVVNGVGQAIIGDANVGLSAQLEIKSSTRGVLFPRMTGTQMNAILSPANGLMVTNTDSSNRTYEFDGTNWRGLAFRYESGGGGTTYTASNGVQLSANDIQLGGRITENTRLQIDSTHELNISSGTSTTYTGKMSSFRLGKDITQFYLQDNNPVRYTEMDISGTDTVGFNFYNGNGGNQSQFNISNGHLKYSRTSGSLFRELPISVNGTYADATGNINISAGGASQWRDTTGGIYYPLGSASIGTTLANTSAKLDVQGTTKGVLLPRLTNAQMLAIASPANGLMVTNTDSLNRIFIYNGAIWRGLAFTNEMAYGGASVDTSLLVHKAGIETITGSKYFTPDINVNGFNIGRGNSNIQTNIAVGDSVLASNTTGTYNSALGFKVLARNTTGGFNSAMGEGALTGNLAGNSNVAIGALALNVFGSAGGFASSNVAIGTQALANATYNPTSGPNVAIGTGAMQFTTTGDINTAVGTQSLYSNTTGANNSALGYWSLHFNTTGSENMGVGTTSLRQNTTGNRNVGIGREAMRTNSTGSGNVGIGYQVGYSSIGNYNVYLGYQAGYYNKADNKLYISNSSTTTPLIYGDFSNGYLSVNNSSTSADTLNSVFSVYSTTKGMYMPRLTEAQMLAIVSPAAGLMITNTDSLNRIFIYTGSAWKGLAYTSEGGSSGGWGLTGNAGTNTTSNFIGTTDNNGLAFRTNNTARLLINPAGNVGIGTVNISDTTYKLFVEKGIRTRKLKVDAASIVWADYVFDKDYKLTSLPELDKFIQQHKHLPGVQSTAEINKNGIDVGENQAVLLKKIEELTLYIIEQDKKAEVQQVTLSQQKNTSADQQQQIDNLKKQMDELKLLIQKKQ